MRQAACLLALVAAIVLLAGACSSDPFDPLLALAALPAVGVACVAGRRHGRTPLEIGVDRDGQLVGRVAGEPDAPARPLQCVFAAPWLITARGGTMWVSIWPDAVAGNVFRRCWVHIRWSRVHAAAAPAATAAREST